MLEDVEWLKDFYHTNEKFKLFTTNAGISMKGFRAVANELQKAGDLNDLTMKFLALLCENKRLKELPEIADKYFKLYNVLNKEEKIIIISSYDLNDSEKDEVLQALRDTQLAASFNLEFKVDPTILGGLQMYTETKFLDLSLKSRLDRIQSELTKISI